MISVRLTPIANGAVLRIEGHGGWAAFELDRAQTETLRDAADRALAKPLEATLAALLGKVS